MNTNRRNFLKNSSAVLGSVSTSMYFTSALNAQQSDSPNERLTFGGIGVGDRWASIQRPMGRSGRLNGVGGEAMQVGDYVSVCDVDGERKARGREITGGKAEMYDDYRKLLERNDIDAVTIITPDHWHTRIALAALQAGKDVYCEKPLTLTIDEGKLICKAVKETGRVFQVGTQQRSEFGQQFLKAVAIAKSGRLGDIRKVTVAIGGAPASGPLKVEPVPSHLNWDMWLGQAPLVEYIPRRSHYEFRWWYEYSGGKMTDWGAHHIDIAQWAMGLDDTGPVEIEPVAVEHPVPLKAGYPTADNQYNTASSFNIRCKFENGAELIVRDTAQDDLGFDNGIMIEGSKGRIFVSRGRLTGAAVEDLASNPLPEDALIKLCKGKQPGNQMGNFAECVKDRGQTISDVFSHHRAMTTCHLCNISIRLGRVLKWDPVAEQILGDDEANGWQSREQRKGYELEA